MTDCLIFKMNAEWTTKITSGRNTSHFIASKIPFIDHVTRLLFFFAVVVVKRRLRERERRKKVKWAWNVEFLVAGEACKAIFWATRVKKRARTFDRSELSTERDLYFCVRSTSLRGKWHLYCTDLPVNTCEVGRLRWSKRRIKVWFYP